MITYIIIIINNFIDGITTIIYKQIKYEYLGGDWGQWGDLKWKNNILKNKK